MYRIPVFARRTATAVIAIMVGMTIAASVAADSVNIFGDSSTANEGVGRFQGVLTYAYDASRGVGTLTVELTNTSSRSNGGKITGFVFNINSADSNTSAQLTSGTHHAFSQATGNGLRAGGSGFGGNQRYDAGAAIGGRFNGGGSPRGGIAAGRIGSFTFTITGSDAASLSARNFIEGGPFTFDFAVRFRGFRDGRSDKVGGMVMIPLPAPLGLALAGIPVLYLARRRYIRNAART
jgi:hypothetical protein